MKTSIFKSIKFKIILLFVVLVMTMVGAVYAFMHRGVLMLEESLIGDRLEADINYIEDIIGEGEWNLKGDAIYLGDTLVGDGTNENANIEPFLEHQDKTGTFSYVFTKCSDEGLGYQPDTDTQEGYQEGHFMRVAGSTRDPNGNSIIGTYISKEVADELDAYGTYKGESNVAGGRIYCLYNVLTDKDGNVIGAIVVGRNVSELTGRVDATTRGILLAVILSSVIAWIIVSLIVSGWTKSLELIADQMDDIESGVLPDMELTVSSQDEVGRLVTRMNRLVGSLKENRILQIKAETDALTGIANRFGLSRFSGETFELCYKNNKTFAVGFLDIDFFKQYNDNYGHQAGDECVKMIANILKEIGGRHNLFCARFGGDEFILIINDRTKDEIADIAQQLQDKVNGRNVEHRYSAASDHVTVSQGYSFGIPGGDRTLDDYIHTADEALYEVKERGRNGFHIADVRTG